MYLHDFTFYRGRKATEVRPESDDSDTERDKETMADLQGVTGQHDNHDEFTR